MRLNPTSLARAGGLAAFLFQFVVSSACAQTVEEFYRDKVVEVYVGVSVGGGYDSHMRVVARHIGKHIPGNPTIVPLNMVGAGGLRLTNWLYNAAPQDGSVFALVNRGIPFEALIGITPQQNIRFDARNFTWIGSATDETSVCVAHERVGIDRFAQLYEKELIVGGVGAGIDADDFPRVLRGALGANFRVVSGYPGGADTLFALERGEVDGRCGWSWSSMQSTHEAWLRDGRLIVLLQMSRAPNLELAAMGVPWVMDLAETDEMRKILNLVFARLAVGRPYIAPPNVPADRVEALRRAFDATMEDPEFIADAGRARLEIKPMGGEDAQKLIEEAYATPQEIVDKTRAMLR
jgi:tripartite-type tricarboxylate transporter receptor subunit TctC